MKRLNGRHSESPVHRRRRVATAMLVGAIAVAGALTAMGTSAVLADTYRNPYVGRHMPVSHNVDTRQQNTASPAYFSAIRQPSGPAAAAFRHQPQAVENKPARKKTTRLPPIPTSKSKLASQKTTPSDSPLVADVENRDRKMKRLPKSEARHRVKADLVSNADNPVSRPATQPTGKSNWLTSITPTSCLKQSLKYLDDANREYAVRAYVSAEASAWKSLAFAAQSIDVTDRQTDVMGGNPEYHSTASQDLLMAKTAIGEARDFQLLSDPLDKEGIGRMVFSHQTTVLKAELAESLQHNSVAISASEAADRYLDYARQILGRLARKQVSAAAALDLLAAIQLGRNEPTRLPAATSLCLRRAAFFGQPANGSLASRLGMQLADMGLDKEAKFALEHAMRIEPNAQSANALATVSQRSGDRQAAMDLIAQLKTDLADKPATPRVPDIIQLTPEQFASVSPSVNTPHALSAAGGSMIGRSNQTGIPASSVGYRTNSQIQPAPGSVPQPTAMPMGQGNIVTGVPTSRQFTPPPSGYNPASSNAYMQPGAQPISKVQQMLERVSEFW